MGKNLDRERIDRQKLSQDDETIRKSMEPAKPLPAGNNFGVVTGQCGEQ